MILHFPPLNSSLACLPDGAIIRVMSKAAKLRTCGSPHPLITEALIGSTVR